MSNTSDSGPSPVTFTESELQASTQVGWKDCTNDIGTLQGLVSEWADRVVPNRTPMSTISKLLEEVGELIASDRMHDPHELADVAILVLDLFNLQKVDMAQAVRNKMEINEARTWVVADNGSARHV